MHHRTVIRGDGAAPYRRCGRIAGLAVSALLLTLGQAQAAPSLPWTPDASGRHALALLVDEAGLQLPLTQWPLPADAVARALDALPTALPPGQAEALARVRRQLQDPDRSRLTLTARGTGEAPAGFGDDATPGSSLALRSAPLAVPGLALQLGGRIQRDTRSGQGSSFRPEGSAVAAEALGLQLQAWSHRSWWGPGWQNSLVLGNNAPALNGLGIQRASAARSESRWLSWMGPWNGEVFVARADTDAKSFVIGSRLTMRPFSHVEIGLSRAVQWGGRGKPQSVASLARALLGRGTNVDDPSLIGTDPGGGIGGFDLRVRCPAAWRCTGYAQLIGEDEAGYLPSKYLGLYGLESWTPDGAHRAYVEFADTTCGTVPHGRPRRGCAYRNHAYAAEGYTNGGRWLGAGVGPDTQILTLGWMRPATGSALRLHAGRIGSRIGSFSPVTNDPRTAGRMAGFGARQGFEWKGLSLSAEIDWLRLRAADGMRTEARAGLTLQMSLDAVHRALDQAPGTSPPI